MTAEDRIEVPSAGDGRQETILRLLQIHQPAPTCEALITAEPGVARRSYATSRGEGFEGVCSARRNAGVNSSFTVRKISYGEGVERVFPLYSPRITAIDVVRRGDVRRAKLYYLRGRTGKAARIAEKSQNFGPVAAATPAADTSKS